MQPCFRVTESRSIWAGFFFVIMIRLGMMLRKLFTCFSISFIFLFTACVSLARSELSAEEEAALYPVSSYVPEFFEWEEVCPGLSRFDFENPDIPLIYHAVKIDLSSTEEGAGGEEVLALTTSSWERTLDFAARENCMVAINATPYDKTKLAGIYKVNGELLSGPAARYAALGLQCGADGAVTRARVFDSQTDRELKDFNYAFGGFFTVLEAGEVRQDFIRRTDSRSGAGISADGRTLYFLVVEGERTRHSIGLSYPQCGQVFRAMGCSDALEFDGGGSAELCINGQSVLNYRVRRVHGNSFGFTLNKSGQARLR